MIRFVPIGVSAEDFCVHHEKRPKSRASGPPPADRGGFRLAHDIDNAEGNEPGSGYAWHRTF